MDPLHDVAVQPSRELGELVVDRLRVLIVTGQLAAGTHLVEGRLSASFGVSRGPIRDALTRLESEGLVESRRRGVFVTGLSQRDIDELYSLREAIELAAIRESLRVDDAQWSVALEPLSRMADAAETKDYIAFAQADLDFHGTFYTIARHSRLDAVWRQYEPTFGVLLTLTTAEDIDLHPSYDSHVEIHQQMVSGDLEAASVTLREHLLGSRNRLSAAYARLANDRGEA